MNTDKKLINEWIENLVWIIRFHFSVTPNDDWGLR
jgi:hypothetical protein